MKILIDQDGELWLERKGAMKVQECPYKHGTRGELCGDQCPLFGEPFDGGIVICGGRTLRGDIIDERTET